MLQTHEVIFNRNRTWQNIPQCRRNRDERMLSKQNTRFRWTKDSLWISTGNILASSDSRFSSVCQGA